MSSSFSLELDTTSPDIQVFAPMSVSPTEKTEIIIESNEDLLNVQDIYIVDSNGTKTVLTFNFTNRELSEIIDFSLIALGQATLFITLRDTVLNSTTVLKIINVINVRNLVLEISESSYGINLSEDSLISAFFTESSLNTLQLNEDRATKLSISESRYKLELSEVELV